MCATICGSQHPIHPLASASIAASRLVLHKISFGRREPVKLVQDLVQRTLVGLDCRNLFGQGRHALDELRGRRRLGGRRRTPQVCRETFRFACRPAEQQPAPIGFRQAAGMSRRDRSCPARRCRSRRGATRRAWKRTSRRPPRSSAACSASTRAASISSSRSSAHLRRVGGMAQPSWARARSCPASPAGRARASAAGWRARASTESRSSASCRRSRRCVHRSCSRRARAATSARASAEAFGIGRGAMNCLLASYQPP